MLEAEHLIGVKKIPHLYQFADIRYNAHRRISFVSIILLQNILKFQIMNQIYPYLIQASQQNKYTQLWVGLIRKSTDFPIFTKINYNFNGPKSLVFWPIEGSPQQILVSIAVARQQISNLGKLFESQIINQHQYYNQLGMDDFDQIYLQRHRKFEEGLRKGMQEAEAYDLNDIIKQGEQFGQEFVRQLAVYQSFHKAIHEQSSKQHPRYTKVEEIVDDIHNMVEHIGYSSLQGLRAQREAMSKKFKLLMTMMGVKKNIQQTHFEIKKNQQALDF